jgi:hypothetical protein
MKYEVEFFETRRHVYTIEAENEGLAESIAEEKYYNEEDSEQIKHYYNIPTENSIGMTREIK